jgi:hypothetical protein
VKARALRGRGENIWPSARCERIRAMASVAHVDGRWQWSADSVAARWWVVAEPPRRRRAHWLGHTAMGRF